MFNWFKKKKTDPIDYTCPFCGQAPVVEERSIKRRSPNYRLVRSGLIEDVYKIDGYETVYDEYRKYSCPDGHMTTGWQYDEFAFDEWCRMCRKIGRKKNIMIVDGNGSNVKGNNNIVITGDNSNV